jgi:hypothetical protein
MAERGFTNLAISVNQEIASDQSSSPVAGLERAIRGDQPLRGVSLELHEHERPVSETRRLGLIGRIRVIPFTLHALGGSNMSVTRTDDSGAKGTRTLTPCLQSEGMALAQCC